MASAEREIQTGIVKALRAHKSVAWCYVTSTGTYKGIKGGRPIRIGIKGMPDIIGQMEGGALLAIEVKVPGKTPSDEQTEFLDMVVRSGGVGFWADSVDSAMSVIDSWANNPKSLK